MKKGIIGLYIGLGIFAVSIVTAEQAFNIEVTAFEISTEILNSYVLPDSSNKPPAYDANKLIENLGSLVKEGKVTLLSKPKINALEEKKASLNVGEDILYMEKINEDTFKLKKLTGKDSAGTFLEVTPILTSDGKIVVSYKILIGKAVKRMKIKGVESLDIGPPIISTRESGSSIVLEDGKPVIAGEMNSQDTTFLTVLTARKITNSQ